MEFATIASLSNREQALWTENIAEYIDRISLEKTEFSDVGRIIIEVFSAGREFAPNELKQRITVVGQTSALAPRSQVSLEDKLRSIAEIYDDAMLWIEEPKIPALRKFITDNIKQRAGLFANFNEMEKTTYLKGLNNHRESVRIDQEILQNSVYQRRQLLAELRGNGSGTSILDERQQQEENQLFYFIHDQSLSEYRNTSLPLNEDVELFRHLVSNDAYSSIFQNLTTLFRDKKEIAMILVGKGLKEIEDFSAELRNDRDVVLAAVQLKGCALEFASLELRSDRDVVLAAVQQNGAALEFASLKLRSDRVVVLASVKLKGWTLQFASPELRSDRDVVLAAVQRSGWALEFASPEFQNDCDVVFVAVQQNVAALEFASLELQHDRDLWLEVSRQMRDIYM